MAEHKHLYQRAHYYDIALERNVNREVDFFMQVYQYYCHKPLTSLLDIACGPGYHSLAIAERGIQTTGIDLMPEMIDLARAKASQHGLHIDYQVGDMRDFTLARPVDMAICVFDAMDALTNIDDVVKHLQTVAQNLTPNGIYLAHYTHPYLSNFLHYGNYSYSGARDGVTVQINWAINSPHFDLTSGIAHVEIELQIDDHGNTFVIQDCAEERIYTPQEIQLLAKLSGCLRVVGWYGDFDIAQPLDSPTSQHMIAILQKD